MLLNKYSAALLQIAIVVIGAYSLLNPPITAAAAWGLVVLGAQAIVTYLVPLLSGAWAGGFKTGAALVIAVIGNLIPFLGQGFWLSGTQISILVLTALNVLASELGVNLRQDAGLIDARTTNNVTALPGDDGLINHG